MVLIVRGLKNALDVRGETGDCRLAFGFLHEQDDNGGDLEHELNDRNYGRPCGDVLLRVVVAAPDGAPVAEPDEVGEEREGHEIPESGFLLWVLVLPEEDGECEEGQVVVSSLEIGQGGQEDEC